MMCKVSLFLTAITQVTAGTNMFSEYFMTLKVTQI